MTPSPANGPERPRYLVAGCKPWNREVFDRRLSHLAGEWCFVATPDQLDAEIHRAPRARYVFFLHWSWIVPPEGLAASECVCFHMTEVPYGRGGSPLQNLIVRGHRATKMTALRMSSEVDAGAVYLRAPLSLEGGAEEILIRATELSADMIEAIIRLQPEPQPQTGEITRFRRRQPAESRVGAHPDLGSLHDFMRMLDAEGYPRAFLEHEGFLYEFSRVMRYHGRLVGDVTITPSSPTPP
jgi:methionyl-tRNA formyltransferase